MPLVVDGIEIPINFKGNVVEYVDKAKKKLAELEAGSKSLAPAVETARKSFTDFISTNAGLIAVAGGTAIAIKKIYSIAKEGAEIEFAKERFDRLAESIGTTGDVLLGKLKEANRGTMSDMDTLAAATDLVSLGLAKNSEEAIRLSTVQTGLAMDTNNLVLTLTNMRTMRFDQLGVSVDGFKERLDGLKVSMKGASEQDIFKEAFLQQAEMQLAKVGNAAESDAGQFKIFEADMKNSFNTMKEGVSTAVLPIIKATNERVAGQKELRAELDAGLISQNDYWDGMNKLNQGVLKGSEILASQTAEQLKAKKAAEDTTAAYEAQTGAVVDDTAAIEKLSKANADIIKDAIDIQKTNDDYLKSQDDIAGQIDDLKAKKEKYYPWEIDKITETQQKIDELGDKYQQNADDYVESIQRKISMDAIEQIALSDGIAGYSDAEYAKAKAILEVTDIASAAAFDQQQAQAIIAQAVVDGTIPVEQYGSVLTDVMADGVISVDEVHAAIDRIPNLTTKEVRISVSTVSNDSTYSGTGLATSSNQSGSQVHAHARGGSFVIPQIYGNEGFRLGNGDTASGGERISITPAGAQNSGDDMMMTLISLIRSLPDTISRSLRVAAAKGV